MRAKMDKAVKSTPLSFFWGVLLMMVLQMAPNTSVWGAWVGIDDRVGLDISNPIRGRRDPTAKVNVTLTNSGADELAGPVRLLVHDLQPASTVLDNASGETEDGVPYFDLDNYLLGGLQPGESGTQFTLVFSGMGRANFTFRPEVQQEQTDPDEPPQPPPMPTVSITQPGTLITVGSSPLAVSGTVSDTEALLTVNGTPTVNDGGNFNASVNLQEGSNTIIVRAVDAAGQEGMATITVSLDRTPPYVTIQSPEDNQVVYTDKIPVSGLVNDIVRGTVTTEDAVVRVNGRLAEVSNRAYLAEDIPLSLGANHIEVSASDAVGNVGTHSVSVTYQAPTDKIIEVFSGQAQSGQIFATLNQPLQVKLTENGQPVAGKTVVFRVIQGDGLLQPGTSDEGNGAIATTDAQGVAGVGFKLGSRAGQGTHRVRARAVGYEGEALFHANATYGDGNKLGVIAGNNQRGAIWQPLPDPFVVAVTDAGSNLIPNAEVEFAVTTGSGRFADGQQTYRTTTDSDGRASARFVLGHEEGLDAQRVTATLVGTMATAGFTASGFKPGDPGQTSISGVVLDNQDTPLPGVTVRVDGTTRQALSDAQGRFKIDAVPVGPVHLIADGSTTTVAGEWPSLSYNLVTVAGVDNPLSAPIYLVKLDTERAVYVGVEDQEITLPEVPGFKLEVAAGSVTFPDGKKEGYLSVTPVNANKIPMPPPNAMQPQFIVTIQPHGAKFDPPAKLTLPNVDAHLPGAEVEMYSYDHDLEEFVTIGLGTVTRDGSLIVSNPGIGVIKAGWHCGSQPGGSGCCESGRECGYCEDPDGECPQGCKLNRDRVYPPERQIEGNCHLETCGGPKLDVSDVPEDVHDCQFCDSHGALTDRPDGHACDDGKYCTSSDGLNPGPDECRGGSCQGKTLTFPKDATGKQEYDFTKLKQLLNGVTLASRFVPGCDTGSGLSIREAIFIEDTKSCCEDEKRVTDALALSGSVDVVIPQFVCRLPAFTFGLATLTANVGLLANGSIAGSGVKDDCDGTCGWSITGSVGATLSGGIAVNVISPDVIEVEGGIRGGGTISVSGGCGDVSASGCIGPPNVYGVVTLGGWITKEVSTDAFDNLIACF